MTAPGFRPTHVVPGHGLPAWEEPDPARPAVGLDPLLPVELVERLGDWGHILCSNGWTAWVDARRLVAVPQDPPAAGAPTARTADPRPLLARAEEALARYRAAVTALADGGLDGESFRTRTRGLRIGLVVDGESVWLYDPDHERWVYTDGTALQTYTADEAPRSARGPDHTPAQDEAPRAARDPDDVPTREQAPRAADEPGHAATQDEAVRAADEPGHTPTQVVAGPPTQVVAGEPTRVIRSDGDPR